MSNTIKAIETLYDGNHFRSRLEARWAIFMDCLNIRYQYEPEGFEDGDTRYLPDFFLPSFGVYLEVKGSRNLFNDRALNKARMLGRAGNPVYVFFECAPMEIREDTLGVMNSGICVGLQREVEGGFARCQGCGTYAPRPIFQEVECACGARVYFDDFFTPQTLVAFAIAKMWRLESAPSKSDVVEMFRVTCTLTLTMTVEAFFEMACHLSHKAKKNLGEHPWAGKL